MNQTKLFPYLIVRLFPIVLVLVTIVISLLFESTNVYVLLIFPVYFLAVFAYSLISKTKIYILSSMLSITTIVLVVHLLLLLSLAAMGDSFPEDIFYYGTIELFIYIVVNVLFEISIWSPSLRSSDKKIKISSYLIVSAILLTLCLGPVVSLVTGSGFESGWSIFIFVILFIATNPLVLVLLLYVLLKKNPVILQKAFLIFSSIYGITLVALPFLLPLLPDIVNR